MKNIVFIFLPFYFINQIKYQETFEDFDANGCFGHSQDDPIHFFKSYCIKTFIIIVIHCIIPSFPFFPEKHYFSFGNYFIQALHLLLYILLMNLVMKSYRCRYINEDLSWRASCKNIKQFLYEYFTFELYTNN